MALRQREHWARSFPFPFDSRFPLKGHFGHFRLSCLSGAVPPPACSNCAAASTLRYCCLRSAARRSSSGADSAATSGRFVLQPGVLHVSRRRQFTLPHFAHVHSPPQSDPSTPNSLVFVSPSSAAPPLSGPAAVAPSETNATEATAYYKIYIKVSQVCSHKQYKI